MIHNLTSLNRYFSLHLTSGIFVSWQTHKIGQGCFCCCWFRYYAGQGITVACDLLAALCVLADLDFLACYCLLPCVLAGVARLAVDLQGSSIISSTTILLHCNTPPQMFDEHSDQRWMLSGQERIFHPPKSAFLVWGMAWFP